LRQSRWLCYEVSSVTLFAALLELLLTTSGTAPGSGIEQVLALEQAGHSEEALARAETLSQQTPPSALAHLEAARLGLKLGVPTASVEKHLQAARLLAPDNPRARYLSAEVKEGQGDDAGARALYLQAVALRSTYTEARTRLVAIGIRSQDWALAEAQLKALVASGERSVGRRLQLARVLEDAAKPAEAEAVLVKLHHEDPTNAMVNSTLADFYVRHGRPKEAQALERTQPAKKLRPLQPSRR
jgi:predicted Zn-dependent protease